MSTDPKQLRAAAQLSFNKDFKRQEPIPDEGIARALEVLRSGELHRYNVGGGGPSDVALLEQEFAEVIGRRYCAALSSCGSALFVALKSAGVKPGDAVLCNAFTLAPVPGAIEHAGAHCVLVEITEDLVVDLLDLKKKIDASGARVFLLSHMRGHVAPMDEVVKLCRDAGVLLVEDCAHTAGSRWDGRMLGTFGAAACFSTQTYKHLNSGEGGLLVTDDADIAAQAVLYSGSYMHFDQHLACPPHEVFTRHVATTANYSLRMSNLQAALVRPQLASLGDRCQRWNERHALLTEALGGNPHIQLPRRHPKESYVGSSFQFMLHDATPAQMERFVAACAERGVSVAWFGGPKPKGYTSRYASWEFVTPPARLQTTDAVLDRLFDFRVPLTFSKQDCGTVAAIILEVINDVFSQASGGSEVCST